MKSDEEIMEILEAFDLTQSYRDAATREQTLEIGGPDNLTFNELALAVLTAGAESRTVLVDPEDPQAAPVLNVLAGPDPDLVVDNLVGIFRSIFSAFWGPRTDDVLRSACLTLLRYAAASGTTTCLADVPRLLADEEFRPTGRRRRRGHRRARRVLGLL